MTRHPGSWCTAVASAAAVLVTHWLLNGREVDRVAVVTVAVVTVAGGAVVGVLISIRTRRRRS